MSLCASKDFNANRCSLTYREGHSGRENTEDARKSTYTIETVMDKGKKLDRFLLHVDPSPDLYSDYDQATNKPLLRWVGAGDGYGVCKESTVIDHLRDSKFKGNSSKGKFLEAVC